MELPCKLPLLLGGPLSAQEQPPALSGTAECSCPALDLLDHPEAAAEELRRYVLAGCDILCAPTAGLSRGNPGPAIG